MRFVYDGTTTDQAIAFNNVVAFQVGGGGGIANIRHQRGPDGHTFSGFDVQLNATTPWTWEPCDPPAGKPCSLYPGPGIDLEAAMAHSWGHVLGHNDLASEDDRLLTDYGGIPSGPDCGPAGPVCRFADTLGLGDVLGVRYMFGSDADPLLRPIAAVPAFTGSSEISGV